MKRIGKILLVVLLILLYTNIGVQATEPSVVGQAAVLMDGSSGRVLYNKNGDHSLPMASTTKILTALVAIEQGNPTDKVIIPPEAQGVEGSSIWLSSGEVHTLEDLLYGLMLRSGNDAATAIAYHIGGSIEGFAALMNETARRIGAENSNFINPHGLSQENHFTTAKDLGLITAHALKNPLFAQIVSSKYRTIPWEGHEWDRAMKNKNKLLWQYEGANGVKTGYTKKAGRCLVASAKRDELQLVAVVLNCGPMFEESALLLDYGFMEFSQKSILLKGERLVALPVKNGKTQEIALTVETGYAMALKRGEETKIRTVLSHPETLEAPIVQGDIIGSVTIFFGDEKMEEIPLIAETTVLKKGFWDFLRKMVDHWR